jgi:predicted transposase YbfD/YdcC
MRNAKKAIVNTIRQDNLDAQVQAVALIFDTAVQEIGDFRRVRDVDYPLVEILFTALVAVCCGAKSFVEIETFGEEQLPWLKNFFPFKNGTPSHDTFTRVFELLNPNSLEKAYRLLIEGLKVRDRKHIAVDGKATRGCFIIKGQGLLHTVSAWDSDNGISLGQQKTKNDEGKDVGEYNTIPILIETIDIEDALVTIDAGGCYANIVDAIVAQGGNYLITIKDNQPTLFNEAKRMFAEVESTGFEGVPFYQESDRGHGRIEERKYYALPVPKGSELRKKWAHLETLMMGVFHRTVKGKTSVQVRYMMTDLSCKDVERLGCGFRRHWGIENRLHWVLDVSFGEDANRTREGNGAENFGKLRRLAHGLLSKAKGKQTIPKVMYRAALSPDFRTFVIGQICGSQQRE